MGFRFRKSVKIAHGLRVNFGLKGTSLSVGGKGATVNFSKRGTRATVGIPGTGISYSENLSGRAVSSSGSNSVNSRNASKGNLFLGFVFTLVFVTWYFGWQLVPGIFVVVVFLKIMQLNPSVPSAFTRKSKEAIEMERRKAEGLELKDIKDIFNKSKIPNQEYVKSAEMKRREVEALKLKDIFRKK